MIEREELFNHLKRTTSPEAYELDLFYKSLEEGNSESTKKSSGLASEDINVFEKEEMEAAIWQQIDEVWQ